MFGYYSYIDKRVGEANPDWRQKDARGEDIRSGQANLCFNTAYRELIRPK